MNDPQQRDRQRLIAPPVAFSSGGEARSQSYAPNSIWTLGVIRDVGKYVGTVWQSGTSSDPGSVLRWQRGRYARGQQPTYGEYEAYGPVETGYPVETKKGADFFALKVSGSDIPGSAVFIRATWRGGFWIIETMGGSEIGQFSIFNFSDYPDSIGAKTWDGAKLGTEIVQIAKPYTLRRTPFNDADWNGITYVFTGNIARRATKALPVPAITEVQVIVPAYQAQQTIYAARLIIGGTGVSYHDDAGVVHNTEWLDLNVDGRQWAKKA